MPLGTMERLLNNKEFDEYWISYLSSHTDSKNRMCHYLGTIFGILGGLLGFIFINVFVGILVGVIGYSVALIGHFVFQKNSPHATKPHIGLICDFLMLYLYVFNKSKLNEQLARLSI